MHAVDAAYVTAGLVVPTATFVGLWLWRLRSRPAPDIRQEPPGTEAELIRSVIAVHDRLDELRRQISQLGDDWEKRDRDLAERISGLIDLTEQAAAADLWVNGDARAAGTRRAREPRHGPEMGPGDIGPGDIGPGDIGPGELRPGGA